MIQDVEIAQRTEWITKPIGEVLDVVTGNTPSKREAANTGDYMPFVKPPELQNELIGEAMESLSELGAKAARVVPAGSVLISCIGNLGRVGLTDRSIAFNQQINAVKPHPEFEPKYLFYYFQGPLFRNALEGASTATTVALVNKGNFIKLPLTYPPLPEQRRIVEAIELQLGRLDAAVARLHAAKAKLKRYKQAVLKAAVEGAYSDTPIEDWTVNVLGDVATTIRNGYSKKPDAEDGIRIFRISAVRPLELFVDDVRYLDPMTADHEKSLVTPGDVLFTRYNGSRDMVGACALVPDDCPPTVHPDKLIRVRVPVEELLPGMLAILGTIGEGRDYIESKIRTTAGQSGISGGDLKSLPICYPPVKDQKRIIEEVEIRLNGMQQMESTLDAQLAHSTRLRQSVLKRAFEGRLV